MSKVVSSNNINKRNALPLTHTYRAMVKNVFWKVNGKRQVPSQHVESRPTSPSSCRFLIWKLYVSCSLLENMFFILTEQHSKAYREPFSRLTLNTEVTSRPTGHCVSLMMCTSVLCVGFYGHCLAAATQVLPFICAFQGSDDLLLLSAAVQFVHKSLRSLRLVRRDGTFQWEAQGYT